MLINLYKGDFLMKCEICGANCENNVCPECGYVNQKPEVETKSDKSPIYGIVSLASAILSYLVSGVFAIFAVVFAMIGKRKNGELDTMSMIGNILGIIRLIISAITIIFALISSILSILFSVLVALIPVLMIILESVL